MTTKIVIIKIKERNIDAEEVQKILTEFGCIIKTRLGVHETGSKSCSTEGLIILELDGTKDEQDDMISRFSNLKSVITKEIEI